MDINSLTAADRSFIDATFNNEEIINLILEEDWEQLFIKTDAIYRNTYIRQILRDTGIVSTEDLLKCFTSIPERLFARDNDLVSITIPAHIESIEGSAFFACLELKTVNFAADSQLSRLEARSFSHCRNLTNIDLPQSLKFIGPRVFVETKISHLQLPDSVQSITPNAFTGMEELEEITLPKNLETLERNLFNRCNKLTKIFYSGSKEQWDALPKDPLWNLSLSEDVEIIYLK